MRISEIKAWVLQVVDAVTGARPIEDSRVELKREMGAANKFARRLAGLVNAAGGDDVLVIIGLDEKANAVTGVESLDFHNWWLQVAGEFDELAPSVQDVMVPVGDGKAVLGLVVNSTRIPHLVRNAMHGSPGGGPVSWEVPWRQGTSVRTARRAELLRLLLPVAQAPTLSLMPGSTIDLSHASSYGRSSWTLDIDVNLFVQPASTARVVFPDPLLRSQVYVVGSGQVIEASRCHLRARDDQRIQRFMNRFMSKNVEEPKILKTVSDGQMQLVVDGPGPVCFYAGAKLTRQQEDETPPIPAESLLELRIDYQAAGLVAARVALTGRPLPTQSSSVVARWELTTP